MNETLLALVADHGALAVFLILAVTSAGVPFPDSLLLLAAGSFAAQGDLDPATALPAGIVGAVVGDQIGYAIGRYGGRSLVRRITDRIGGADKVKGAENFANRWAGPGIFFTRWLVGALGPWINLTSGMTGYSWPRFLAWDVAGETLWVLLYGGLGYVFSDRIQAIADVLGNLSWAIAGVAATLFIGWRLFRAYRPATDTAARSDVARAE